MPAVLRASLAVIVLALVLPGGALAATSAGQVFPSNLYTTADSTQLTGLRVDLPKPDCATHASDCADIAVLDTLDGFNIQPRISIPFSGPIDLSTVTSSNIFLVGPGGQVVGINQAVWEPAANTLHVESDQQLAQDTTYLLVVSRGVHDASGAPLGETSLLHDLNFGQTKDAAMKAYRKALIDALPMALAGGVEEDNIAAVSLFTTQSINAISKKIRAQLTGGTANFNLGTAGQRTVFPVSSLAAIQLRRQNGTASFATSFVYAAGSPLQSLLTGVGTIAYGSYSSPDYETSAEVIPAVGTKTGVPAVQSVNQLEFSMWEPAGTPPAGGWPTAIFGHGFTDSKDGAPLAVAGTLARNGIATIAINVVGHGGGAAGSLTIIPAVGTPVTIPDGGRGIDQDGNGTIDSTEGVSAAPPRGIIANRDGLRQTVADLMQLVRVLETGGIPGLNGSRIYYAGQSFGGIYGVKFLAVEPSVRAGVPNVPGGPIIEIARLSPSFRVLVGLSLATRIPALLNAGALAPPTWGFNENIPLRDRPTVINSVPGAMEIQEVIDNTEWVSQSGSPVAYAPHLRQSPLDGVDARPVIIQFAKGDQTVPNPTASAIFRAGDLTDRSTYFRNDLVRAAIPGAPANPHTFLTRVDVPSVALLALAAQKQIAIFFETDGAVIIDPDGAGPLFEVPIAGPLPEGLNF